MLIPIIGIRPIRGRLPAASLPVIPALLAAGLAGAADFTVASPDGRIVATLTHDQGPGTVTYRVTSGGAAIIDASHLGIDTDKGDFTAGMALAADSRAPIDETYALPVGKRSIYVNRANEITLKLTKGGQDMLLRFRAYDDGVAYRYAFSGAGNISISGEVSAISLSGGGITYWGQSHPNNYGYESMLGELTGNRFSMPVLARLGDRNHYILAAQAGSYGSYIVPNFQRQGSSLKFAFPMDQTAPVSTVLPFESPWRLVIISPLNLGKIVESTLFENLNPPTEPALASASWLKAGRASWDFLAGDKNKPDTWVDFTASMGWEYYLADAGFVGQFGGEAGVKKATEYAGSKNVSIIGWAYGPSFYPRDAAAKLMKTYADMGLKGVKIDFFDRFRAIGGSISTNDMEDTQVGLQMRDWMMELGVEYRMVLEFHGCTVPSGERRRFPNFMTAEAVAGMEKKTPDPAHELLLPYIRNIAGPMSFTLVKFDRAIGSHAYQLAASVIYEAGIQIYAERHDRLAAWAGAEFIRKAPASWDETRFIEGGPGTHAVFARRKGHDWFIGGMTNQARTVQVPLAFLAPGTVYEALVFRDGATNTAMVREERKTTGGGTLTFTLRAQNGFAVYLHPPVAPVPIQPPLAWGGGRLHGAVRLVGFDKGRPMGGWKGLIPAEAWPGGVVLSLHGPSGRRVGRIESRGPEGIPDLSIPDGVYLMRAIPAGPGRH